MKQTQLNLPARIERLVFLIRTQRVMLDSELARIYGVSTTRLTDPAFLWVVGHFAAGFMASPACSGINFVEP